MGPFESIGEIPRRFPFLKKNTAFGSCVIVPSRPQLTLQMRERRPALPREYTAGGKGSHVTLATLLLALDQTQEDTEGFQNLGHTQIPNPEGDGTSSSCRVSKSSAIPDC